MYWSEMDTGRELRETFSQAHTYFAELYDAREFIVDFDNKIEDIKQSIENIEDAIGELPEDIEQIGEGVKQLITTDLTDLGEKIKNISIDLDDVKVDQALSDAASQTVYIKENEDLPGDTLYQIASEIKNIYRNLYTICRYSNDDICEDIREFAHSDFMKTITLGTALYDFFSYDKCLKQFAFQAGGYEGSFCGNSFKIPKGTDFVLGVNNILADDLLIEAWRKDTGDVVYSQHVEVPNPDPDNPLQPAEVQTGWNWRDSTGHLVKPGEYGVRAKYTDITGKQKVIDVLGKNEIGYPVEPGELYNGVFDNEILGGGVAETTFHIDAGQEYLLFEFDFLNRRGAFSVVSVELQIYDLNEELVWKETRQMPVLGDEDTRGYDNTFVWNLKNINTGESVPDAEYTYRLVTTMQSGKQYINYFTRYVVRPTIEEPEEPEVEEPEPAVAIARIPDPGIDRYMNYQFDENGIITGAKDAFGNSYSFERDESGNITGAIYPDGSHVDYHQGGKMPGQIKDRNGNAVNYVYDAQGRTQSVADAFGNTMNFAYPQPGKVSVTNQAGHTTTKTLNELGLPTHIAYPDGATESSVYDQFGNLKQSTDPMGRITKIDYNENNQPVRIEDALGNVTSYEYDDAFNLVKVTDPSGNETNMTYDDRGNMLTVTDPAGRAITYTYDTENRPISVTDPGGNTTSYVYNPENGVLITVNNPDGSSISYTYYTDESKKNLVKTVTDARGGVWNYNYDGKRNVTSVTNPLGQTATFVYNAKGQVTSATDFAGRTATYEYDTSNGNLLRMTEPIGRVTEYTYDTANRVKTIRAPNGGVTAYGYDAMDRVTSVTDPLGHSITTTYFPDGSVQSVTDPKGNTTRFDYDAAGRLKKVYDPDNNYIEYTYDTLGRVTAVRNPRGKTTTYGYDASGQLTSVTDPMGYSTLYRYDSRGQLSEIEDAEHNITTRTYDEMGRLTSVTDPLGNTVSMTYDANGNLTSVTDPRGHVTQYEYDALDRLTVEHNAQGMSTLYSFDEAGNVNAVTDEKGNTTNFTYDELDRMTMMCNALSQCENYSYDVMGNIASVTNRRGTTISYTYDANGNLLTKSYSGYSALFTYDANGNLLTAQDNNSSISYQYDAHDRVTSVTSSGPDMPTVTNTYSYDTEDNVIAYTGPNGNIGYSYDDVGRLLSLDSPAGAFTYTYNPRDMITSLTYPNGVVASYAYDDAGQLLSLINRKGTNTISSFEYEYDPNGNRIKITDLDGVHTYGYDELDQLISADHPSSQAAYNPDEFYQYDPVGNRIKSHLSNTHVHNSLNQLIEDDFYYYEHDLDGNLIKKTEKNDPNNVTLFAFNDENKPISIILPDDNYIAYKYDVIGRRIKANENGISTTFTYDGYDISAEYGTVMNEPGATYIYGPGIDNIYAQQRYGATYYSHKDFLQSIFEFTNSDAEVVQSNKYDSFGNVVYISDRVISKRAFTGREWERAIGMYFSRNRFMNPQNGSFTSEDPVWNASLYRYGKNNPLKYLDPFGLHEYILVKLDPGHRGEPHYLGPNAIPEAINRFKDYVRNTLKDEDAIYYEIDLSNAGSKAFVNFRKELIYARHTKFKRPVRGGMQFFGHGWNPGNFNWAWKWPLEWDPGQGTNMLFRNLFTLPRDIFAPGAVITVRQCAMGTGGRESIPAWMAFWWQGANVQATNMGVESFPDKGGIPAAGKDFASFSFDPKKDKDKLDIIKKYPMLLKGNYNDLNPDQQKEYRKQAYKAEKDIFIKQGCPYSGFPAIWDAEYYNNSYYMNTYRVLCR